MDIAKIREAKARLTPETGANLVGVDTFETDEHAALYLVGHYPSVGEAEDAKRERLRDNAEEVLHVYPAGSLR